MANRDARVGAYGGLWGWPSTQPPTRPAVVAAIAGLLWLSACESGASLDGDLEDAATEPALTFRVVTFNTGTTLGLAHDGPPDDGYTMEMAALSDEHYGDGLAWIPAVDAVQRWVALTRPDIIVFQEIFHAEDCTGIPAPAQAGFFCQGWSPGDDTVVQAVLAGDYQIACHRGKADKCAAVRRSFGTFRGCMGELCLGGLEGSGISGCGRGARVGRGVIELREGGEITLVSVHGSSGIETADQDCRVAQFEQVFVDLDGAPGASGDRYLVMGDFNTDPVRLADGDPSAARLVELVDDADATFITEIGRRVTPTYADLFNIDHVIAQGFEGTCVAPGIMGGEPSVIDAVYFDHVPIVCDVSARSGE